MVVSACGGSHPTGPTPDAPQIACPLDISASGVADGGQAVNFAAPTVTGGAAPLDVGCTPASGQFFPLGTTPVTCSVKDALQRQAACSFNVVLRGFTISVTRYETVGDSLTEGENGRPLAIVPSFLDTPNAYPTKLQQDFDRDYPGQGVAVINRGHSGDPVELTVSELPGFLAADKPGAVLILSGYNNLGGCSFAAPDPPVCSAGITAVAFGIRDCIRRVKESPLGIKYIFVSTLTPPGPYLGGVRDRRIGGDAIVQANAAIRQMIGAEGATLVDTYPLFLGHEAEYVDTDGLHLRPAGYQVLADAFFAAIISTVPASPFRSLSAPR